MENKAIPMGEAVIDTGQMCVQNKNEDVPVAAGTPSGGNDWRRDSISILADPYLDVKNLLRLKEIREGSGVMGKDIAPVVACTFPKFNRQLLSQCEHWDTTGVIIHPDGLRLICEALNVNLTEAPKDEATGEDVKPKKRKKAKRKLAVKKTIRMTAKEYEWVQKQIVEGDFLSMQAWFTALLRSLRGATDEHS